MLLVLGKDVLTMNHDLVVKHLFCKILKPLPDTTLDRNTLDIGKFLLQRDVWIIWKEH